VLTGEDAQYHNALVDGADGAILLSAHVETEAFAAVRTMLWEGNQDGAQRTVARGRRPDEAAVHRADPSPAKHGAWLAQRADRQPAWCAADGGGQQRAAATLDRGRSSAARRCCCRAAGCANAAWLRSGESIRSTSRHAAAATLNPGVWMSP
jgi:dihydrodipicolinate synthase/N-acetylneuraminate lyase